MLNPQPASCHSLDHHLDSFDPLNFFNLDVSDFQRFSRRNSATYDLLVLASVLPLSSAPRASRTAELLEETMVAYLLCFILVLLVFLSLTGPDGFGRRNSRR
jgi:hypothetical protein